MANSGHSARSVKPIKGIRLYAPSRIHLHKGWRSLVFPLGNSKITQRIFDVWTYDLPEELRIIGPQVSGAVVFELFDRPGFTKLCKQRRRLAQIVDVGELADQVCRP